MGLALRGHDSLDRKSGAQPVGDHGSWGGQSMKDEKRRTLGTDPNGAGGRKCIKETEKKRRGVNGRRDEMKNGGERRERSEVTRPCRLQGDPADVIVQVASLKTTAVPRAETGSSLVLLKYAKISARERASSPLPR